VMCDRAAKVKSKRLGDMKCETVEGLECFDSVAVYIKPSFSLGIWLCSNENPRTSSHPSRVILSHGSFHFYLHLSCP